MIEGLQLCYLTGFRKEVCSIHDPLGKTFQVFETRQRPGSSVRVAEVAWSPSAPAEQRTPLNARILRVASIADAPAEQRTPLNARILRVASIADLEDLIPGERLAPGYWYEIIAD